jgi:pSer/pThr/pTyr-binding forkhead associated (FHA) protein
MSREEIPGTRTLAASALRRAAAGEQAGPARVRFLGGPLAGCPIPLGEEETLGRGSGATLQLVDPAASRRHLQIRVSAGRVQVLDLGSKNGAAVNGRPLGRRARRLHAGDVVALGTTRLELELDGEPGAASPGPPGWLLAAAAALLLAAAATLLLG